MATPTPGLFERFDSYRPSKAALGWSCVLCVIATVVIGFNWGGWVTGGTAADMAAKAAQGASAQLAAGICAAQFNSAPDVTAQRAALTKLDTWARGDFLKKGGWVTLPGSPESITGAADLCARRLVEAKL